MNASYPDELPTYPPPGAGGLDYLRINQSIAQGLPFLVRQAASFDSNLARLVPQVASRQQWCAGETGRLVVATSQLHPGGRSGPPFNARPMTIRQFFASHYAAGGTQTAPAAGNGASSSAAAGAAAAAGDGPGPGTEAGSGAAPRFYLQQVPVCDNAVLRAWLGNTSVPFGCQPDAYACSVFAGARGITTSLHYDRQHFAQGLTSMDNFFVQCSGTKRFELWRPADHAAMYPRGEPLPPGALAPGAQGWRAATSPEDLRPEALRESPHVSRICDLEEAARAAADGGAPAWPGFAAAHARRYTVTLGPGDALYIPRWWWHKTTALSEGTAMNWWFLFAPEEGEEAGA